MKCTQRSGERKRGYVYGNCVEEKRMRDSNTRSLQSIPWFGILAGPQFPPFNRGADMDCFDARPAGVRCKIRWDETSSGPIET